MKLQHDSTLKPISISMSMYMYMGVIADWFIQYLVSSHCPRYSPGSISQFVVMGHNADNDNYYS